MTTAAATAPGAGSAATAPSAPIAKRPSVRLRSETCKAEPPWYTSPANPLPDGSPAGHGDRPSLGARRPKAQVGHPSYRQKPAGLMVLPVVGSGANAKTLCNPPADV